MRAPHPGVNSKGYWEHLEIVQVHDRLLGALGSSWDDIGALPDHWWKLPVVQPFRQELLDLVRRDFSDTPLWGLKDPRMCRLLPLWREIFDEVGVHPIYVLTHRDPIEVAGSLRKRDQFSLPKAGLVWLIHNVEMESGTRGATRAFASFEQLLREPLVTLEGIRAATNIHFPRSVSDAASDLAEFLEPRLRHHVSEVSIQDAGFGVATPLIRTCVESLRSASRGETPAVSFEELERVTRAYLAEQDPASRSHIADLELRLDRSRGHPNAVMDSRSWSFLRPLRFLERLSGRRSR
jgi:hypothetical protein